MKKALGFVAATLIFTSCLPYPPAPLPGPDKQFIGTVYGAALGAGSGAVMGAQVMASAGPGAFIGAGFGAVYGAITGLGLDALEEDQLRRMDELEVLQRTAWAQEVLSEHYRRRIALHPRRDIYPADLFFLADTSELSEQSQFLVRHIAKMNRSRLPWSRILIVSYIAAKADSAYAEYLAEKRSEAIATEMVQAGIEPRRLSTKAVLVSEPVLIDPFDSPDRYKLAFEFLPLDP